MLENAISRVYVPAGSSAAITLSAEDYSADNIRWICIPDDAEQFNNAMGVLATWKGLGTLTMSTSGGNVVLTFSGALVDVGYTVFVWHDEGVVDFTYTGTDSLVQAVQSLVRKVNELSTESARSFKVPEHDSDSVAQFATLATQRAGKVLAFDADGNLMVGLESVPEIAGLIATMKKQSTATQAALAEGEALKIESEALAGVASEAAKVASESANTATAGAKSASESAGTAKLAAQEAKKYAEDASKAEDAVVRCVAIEMRCENSAALAARSAQEAKASENKSALLVEEAKEAADDARQAELSTLQAKAKVQAIADKFGDVDEAVAGTQAAQGAAEEAQKLAEQAQGKAEGAQAAAEAARDTAVEKAGIATTKASEAGASATLAKSWAVGGTNSRDGEDTNNAKYYATQAANRATTATNQATIATEKANTATTKADEASASAAAAATSAGTATTQAGVAKAQADIAIEKAGTATTASGAAAEYAMAAANQVGKAIQYATQSKMYAVGGTGTAVDEEVNNAKYYATQAANRATTATNQATIATEKANTATTKADGASASAAAAATSAGTATSKANAAATSATNASNSATLAQSWAVGGTNTRTGEDTNNSKYWAEQSSASASSASVSATTATNKASAAFSSAVNASVYANEASASLSSVNDAVSLVQQYWTNLSALNLAGIGALYSFRSVNAAISAKNSGELIPGAAYRIPYYPQPWSYDTLYVNGSWNMRYACGSQTDIVLFARSQTEFYEEGRMILSQDNMSDEFANCDMAAWKIWVAVCDDCDSDKRGDYKRTNNSLVITRMIDELGNDLPFDFKHFKFYVNGAWRCAFDDGNSGDASLPVVDSSGNRTIACYNNKVEATYGTFTTGYSTGLRTHVGRILRPIVFSGSCHDNTITQATFDYVDSKAQCDYERIPEFENLANYDDRSGVLETGETLSALKDTFIEAGKLIFGSSANVDDGVYLIREGTCAQNPASFDRNSLVQFAEALKRQTDYLPELLPGNNPTRGLLRWFDWVTGQLGPAMPFLCTDLNGNPVYDDGNGGHTTEKTLDTMTLKERVVQLEGEKSALTLKITELEQTLEEFIDMSLTDYVKVADYNVAILGLQQADSDLGARVLSLENEERPVNAEEITYADLVAARDAGTLVAGTWYRITDYETIVAATEVETSEPLQSAGNKFDVLVLATSTTTLSEKARAVKSARDTANYFANAKIDAWELKYCLDNDADRFAWANTTSGKGVIYELKDEHGNECGYDFKNIQFKMFQVTATSAACTDLVNGYYAGARWTPCECTKGTAFVWRYTFDGNVPTSTSAGTDATLFKQTNNQVHGNVIKPWVVNKATGQIRRLNAIVFYGFGSYSQARDNVFEGDCYRMSFGAYCYFNSFGAGCSSNSFGAGCYSNSFGESCYYNSFGASCSSNSFGAGCYSNSFGADCYYNSFGAYCRYNSFGAHCSYNSFGADCSSTSFGANCSSNSFVAYCRDNSFGVDCSSNSFGAYCSSNSFGAYCSSNSFGANCYSNSFGAYCYFNSFGASCYYNSFGAYCSSNSFGASCYFNSFGAGCSSNSFGASAKFNGTSEGISFCTFKEGMVACMISSSNSSGAHLNMRIALGTQDGLCTAGDNWSIDLTATGTLWANTGGAVIDVVETPDGNVKMGCAGTWKTWDATTSTWV